MKCTGVFSCENCLLNINFRGILNIKYQSFKTITESLGSRCSQKLHCKYILHLILVKSMKYYSIYNSYC